jgi:protein-S-isoprenylcysteine O-methyltransferase Ste14
MEDEQTTAGVLAPPPLIMGSALLLGLLLGRGELPSEKCTRATGFAIGASGALLGLATIAALKRGGTNLDPYKPSTALVTNGIFRFTRNPAYLGLTAIYIGVAFHARSLTAFALLPAALIVLERGVVEREERYLEARFGEDYRAYRASVPRWF